MRAAAIALALLFTPAAAGAQASATQDPASPVPVYGYEVVRVWPHDRTAFTQGLAWHEGDLLESTGRYPSTVRRVRLDDGALLDLEMLDTAWFGEGLTETGRVPVTLRGRPIGQINELEWIDGEVFANVWQTDFIVRIDPASGVVKGVIDLAALMPDRSGLDPTDAVLNGIAWDPEGRRLFVTGKNWPTLFEIKLIERPGN